MADPTTALMVMAGGAKIAQVGLEARASNANIAAIDMQREQKQIEFQQKTLANFELTNKILDTQLSEASTRGITLNSPSFIATETNTLNTSGKAQKNLEIEHNIFERNAKIEKRNVRDALFSQIFGDVTKAATSIAGAKAKMA